MSGSNEEELTVSVLKAGVRMGITDSWEAAREMLRQQVIYPACPLWHRTCSSTGWRDKALARLARMPDGGLPYAAVYGPAGDVYGHAEQGLHGLAEGDTACLHDYHDPGAWGWTICVPYRITGVGALVIVEALRDAAQLSKGDRVAVHHSVVRPPGHQ